MAQQEDIISSYVDRTGVESDTEFMLKNLNDVLGAMKRINSIKISLEGANSFKAAAEATKAYKKEQDELLKIQGQIDAAYKRRIALETEQGKILAEEKELLRQRNQELKNALREQNAATGSLEQMRATLIRLNKEYDNLSKAERDAAKGQELKTKISGLSEELKKLEGETGRFQRNVGNYQGSAKIIVDALGQVEKKIGDLKEKQQQFQNFSKSNPIGFKLGNGGDSLNQVNAELAQAQKEFTALQNIANQPTFLRIASNVGDANQELRGFTKTLIDLERNGLGKTDFAQEIRKHLAELKDQIEDTRGEIKKMSSDSRQFDEFANSVNFLANSFQTGVGAIELFGGKTDESAEAVRKLLAVQALANGVQGIAQQLTERGTVINKAAVFVQGLYKTAIDSSAAATTRLAAASKLLFGGFIIGAIVLLVEKIIEWSKAATAASEATKNLSEVTAKAADKFAEANVKVNEMKETLRLAKEGVIDKEKALKQYNESIGKTVGQANSLNEAEQLLIKKAPEYIQFTLLKAKAEAAAELAKESLKKSVEDSVKNADEFLTFGEKAKTQITSFRSFLNLFGTAPNAKGIVQQSEQLLKIGQKNKQDAVKTEQDKYKEFSRLQQEFFDEAATFAHDHKLNFFEDAPEKKKDNKKDLENQLRARFELYKIEQERELELINRVIDDEKASYPERLTAAISFVQKKQALITDTAEFEKKLGKKSKDEIDLIDKQASLDKIRTAEQVEGKLREIQERIKKEGPSNIDVFGTIDVNQNSIYNDIISKLDKYKQKQLEIEEIEKRRKELLTEFANEAKETIFAVFTAGFDKQKNKIQEEIDLIDKRKQKEIEAVNQTLASQQDKANQIAVINATAQAQSESLQLKQKQLDEKKAKFDRAKSITDIIQNTASGIVKALAEFPGPVGIGFAALIGSIGALQLARTLATPIPKYFRGKGAGDNYEGPAWVDDGGKPEAIIREDGSVEVGTNKPRITYLNKNDIVLPDAKMLAWNATTSASRQDIPVNNSFDVSELLSEQRQTNRYLKAIKNKPAVKFYNAGVLDQWMNSNKSWNDFN